jgi:hypothetical protein
MPRDSFKRARAPLRLAAFGGKNYNGSRRVEKPRARPMALRGLKAALIRCKLELVDHRSEVT